MPAVPSGSRAGKRIARIRFAVHRAAPAPYAPPVFDAKQPRRRRRIPLRTLILMILALAATIRFIWISYERSQAERRASQPDTIIDVRPVPPETGDR